MTLGSSAHVAYFIDVETKRYLAVQALFSILVNGGIGAGTSWSRRHEPVIDVWGAHGLAPDTLVAALLLSTMTILIGSRFVRLDVRKGRVQPLRATATWAWAPTDVWKRALLFGPLWACAGSIVALVVLSAEAVQSVSFAEFLRFKVIFSVLLGLLVTPFNAQAVLVEMGAPDARRGHAE